jgi:hypothetical protein
MPYYQFPQGGTFHDEGRPAAFCDANGINPRGPISGSTFEVTDDGVIITREFFLQDGRARVWHEGCCGSTHFAKREGRYAMLAKPEDYGFEALRTSDGSVAP